MEGAANCTKHYFWKKRAKVSIFLGEKKLKSPYLDHDRFLHVANIYLYILRFQKISTFFFLLFSLTCSQNWLSSLMDDG
jgi:hypothetical protein